MKYPDMEQIVVFTLDEVKCGVNIAAVQEIIRMQTLTAVSGAEAHVAGIINLRGQIITVIDLREKLGCTCIDPDSEGRILIVRDREGLIGLRVDTVLDVLPFHSGDFEAGKPRLDGIDTDHFSGIYKTDDMLILILDLPKVLDEGSEG